MTTETHDPVFLRNLREIIMLFPPFCIWDLMMEDSSW